jgi:hypothetical protein
MNNFALNKFVVVIFCFLLLVAESNSQSASSTRIVDSVPAEYSTRFKFSTARYYSESPIIYISPATAVAMIDSPLATSTQIFVLPGTNGQKLTLYGYNIANKLHVRNADALFYMGNRDIWEAIFFNNKWIETSRTDL